MESLQNRFDEFLDTILQLKDATRAVSAGSISDPAIAALVKLFDAAFAGVAVCACVHNPLSELGWLL